jgi:hypothetical protein
MVIERFSQNVISSGVFKLYIATGFFATLIFFVVNADLFTPLEMLIGIIGVTIVLKGISNMMLSLIILLFNFDNKQAEIDFQYNSEKIDSMLAELSIRDATDGSNKPSK